MHAAPSEPAARPSEPQAAPAEDPKLAAILERLDALTAEVARLRKALGEVTDEHKISGLISTIAQKERTIRDQHAILVGLWPLRKVVGLVRPRLFSFRHHRPKPLAALEPVAAPDPAPRISVVTPAFRHAHFLEATMKSVLDQDYPNLQYIVQDGGSDDGTVELLQRYESRLASWQSAPDHGQSDALNKGFARADGEIMAWLNSDDLLLPGALAAAARFFEAHPEVDVLYGHRFIIDELGRQIGTWIMPAHDDAALSWADYVPQETLFWRRLIWEKAGGRIDDSFQFAMDWDLLLRLRDAGAKMVRLPRPLGAFRVYEAQKTSANITQTGADEMARIRRRIHGYVPPHEEIRAGLTRYMAAHVAAHYAYFARERFRGLRSMITGSAAEPVSAN